MIAWGVLRIAGTVTALVVLYYLLPLDHSSTGTAVTILVIGLAVFIALVAFQTRAIIRSPFPGLTPSRWCWPWPSVQSPRATRTS